jgi:hypothetical protein
MVSKRRGVLVALIIGSVIGGTASVTIMDAASASQSRHERAEAAQHQSDPRYGPESSAT